MSIHELRDLDEARKFIHQGLQLQRRIAPTQMESVRPALEWALEIASSGEPLPPVGFVADVGVEVFDMARGQPARAQALPFGLPPTLARTYEDHVLGKIYADWTFERAKDALKLYAPGRERTRGLAFLINQLRQRAQFDGVLLSPAVIRAMLDAAPDETLRRGRESLQSDGLMPLLEECYTSMVAAARRTAEVLGEPDVRALEHRTALAEEGQRLAHDQAVGAMVELRDAMPRHRVKPLPGRHEVPTRVLDEDTYPVGGFSSISTRGTVESLLHSQLAYMDDAARPDLFDIKYVRDELYYYSRDENQFLRRRRTFVIAFNPDLAGARFKDPEATYQRIVYLLGFLHAAVDKLTDWLSADALRFDFVFLHEDGSFPLRHEYELLEMLFRERIDNGTVRLYPARHLLPGVSATADARRASDTFAAAHTPADFAALCRARSQRSLCQVLTVSMNDQPIELDDLPVARLTLAEANPSLVHAGEAELATLEWPAALERLLQLWV
jgi:hypothetical protein